MVSERVGDGFSRGGNVFSRRVAECAEFSQSILSMLLPFGRVGVGRCVSKLKSEEASGEQKLACAIPSAEAFRAKHKERGCDHMCKGTHYSRGRQKPPLVACKFLLKKRSLVVNKFKRI